jgi:hypothetical protein
MMVVDIRYLQVRVRNIGKGIFNHQSYEEKGDLLETRGGERGGVS